MLNIYTNIQISVKRNVIHKINLPWLDDMWLSLLVDDTATGGLNTLPQSLFIINMTKVG